VLQTASYPLLLKSNRVPGTRRTCSTHVNH